MQTVPCALHQVHALTAAAACFLLLTPAGNHMDVLCSLFSLAVIAAALSGTDYTLMLSIGAVGALVMFMVREGKHQRIFSSR